MPSITIPDDIVFAYRFAERLCDENGPMEGLFSAESIRVLFIVIYERGILPPEMLSSLRMHEQNLPSFNMDSITQNMLYSVRLNTELNSVMQSYTLANEANTEISFVAKMVTALEDAFHYCRCGESSNAIYPGDFVAEDEDEIEEEQIMWLTDLNYDFYCDDYPDYEATDTPENFNDSISAIEPI
jgi:hypothetical protein